jgi:hypothetical protein
VEILSHNGPAYKVKVSGAGTFLTWRSGAQERIPAWISGVIDVTYVGQKEVVSTGN